MLPHSFPFRLIDGSFNSTRAIVELSANASLLRGRASLPISLVVEIIAQAAAYLLAADEVAREPRLAAIESAVLTGPATVGERLMVSVSLERRYGRLLRIRGELQADGMRVGEATMILSTQPAESTRE